MEKSKRVGAIWYRATVQDILQKKGKGYSFTPKFTVIYANSKDAAAALDTLLPSNNYQPKQAEGTNGAIDALTARILTHQDRLRTILEHFPTILENAQLAQISRQEAQPHPHLPRELA